jgi:hypothetical protein
MVLHFFHNSPINFDLVFFALLIKHVEVSGDGGYVVKPKLGWRVALKELN